MFNILKRTFKQYCSRILPISTKLTTTYHHLKSLHIKKTMTYDLRKPGPGLEQESIFGWIKPIYAKHSFLIQC